MTIGDPVRLGISKEWVPRKRVIEWVGTMTPWTMEQAIAYNNGAVASSDEVRAPPASYDPVGYRANLRAQALALEGKPWEQAMADALRYQLFGYQLDFFWHRQFRLLFQNHHQPLRLMNWAVMTEVMALCFAIGWIDRGLYQAHLTHAALNRGYHFEPSYDSRHRCTHAFMLRLVAAYCGDLSHEWPSFAFAEPVYEYMVRKWNTPDPQELLPWLLVACDRHTYQGRPDTTKQFWDCSNFPQTPLEVLLLFKLRGLAGLENPTLDHPLMAAPFDKPTQEPPDYTPDDLMIGTLSRVRRDWPDFDQQLTLDEIGKVAP